ncbi:DNA repair helicase [Ecytonucleospora hepatopenaei]|uniref:DNA 5'-3' helicase n=1 Tax=Ecytonucleospora hepatopenaei TaxID=646526 RepID=A0A1W0E7U0_9MICR|nr:DNA repair helicase [Ecytonucleospora hepatopenaei]
MPIVKINGYTIKLPFNPYEAQIKSMETLLNSFDTGNASLIESPTGTGKSLAILCAALGYLETLKGKENEESVKKVKTTILDENLKKFFNEQSSEEEKKKVGPKIYIASRTHKQLDQLVSQLRTTDYNPSISVLGSRTQYCINSKAKNALDINTACRDLVDSKQCHFRHGVGRLKKKVGNIFDIEEIKEKGKNCAGCPYFAARELAENADVIFAPYNYLLDPRIRNSMDIDLDGSIVIIDEAHNVEDTCRSAGSFEFDSKLLDLWTNELLSAARKSALLEKDVKPNFLTLIEFIGKFKKHKGITCNESNFEFNFKIFKGKQILQQLEQMEISQISFNVFTAALGELCGNEEANSLMSQSLTQSLRRLEFVFSVLFTKSTKEYVLCYKQNKKESEKFEFSFWLLDSSLIFNLTAARAKAVCLLSGTLTPFYAFSSELKFGFKNQLVAPHILQSNQVFIANVQKGHLKKELTGTYAISETKEYLLQIAKIIEEIGEMTTPYGGTIVFLPSYAFLKKVNNYLKIKAILEPQTGGNEKFEKVLKSYRQVIEDKTRSVVFMCVYRGKASEGIDFKDEYARAVVAIGIPYPSIKDPQINVKKEFNDNQSRSDSTGSSFNGSQWYSTQAMRAVNQALGRVVRHPKDWGSVFLLETRYKTQYIKKQLPAWVTEEMKEYETFSSTKANYKKFLEEKKMEKFK